MDDQADDFIEKQDAKEKNAPLKKDSLTPNQGPMTSTFIESTFIRNQKEHKPMNNHSSISKPRESEANSKSRVLDRFQRVPTPTAASPIMNHGIILSKQAEEEDLDFVNSRYSGQLIRPYIRRDFDVVPRKLQLLRAVQERTADRQRLPLTDHPLDFCFIQVCIDNIIQERIYSIRWIIFNGSNFNKCYDRRIEVKPTDQRTDRQTDGQTGS